jgi:hypothetical protein
MAPLPFPAAFPSEAAVAAQAAENQPTQAQIVAAQVAAAAATTDPADASVHEEKPKPSVLRILGVVLPLQLSLVNCRDSILFLEQLELLLGHLGFLSC